MYSMPSYLVNSSLDDLASIPSKYTNENDYVVRERCRSFNGRLLSEKITRTIEDDFWTVCSAIEDEKEILFSVSQDIWKKPELAFKEIYAHTVLTTALTRYGFKVQKQYLLPTAFRAEFSSKSAVGPVIGVILEYDALPEIGHACGHNLIAEAGLAAGIGIKAAMELDSTLAGKVVLLGTPAEERGGGKCRLIEKGAFEGLDVALMVHPFQFTKFDPSFTAIESRTITFTGKESHASAFPWEGFNALDAAVSCYHNLSLLRQQIKPSQKFHSIITRGGVAPNIIPGETEIRLMTRAPTSGELKALQTRVDNCISSAAKATGCCAQIDLESDTCYDNLISNKVLTSIYGDFARRLGMHETEFKEGTLIPTASTDMGSVSHVVPSIHPVFHINTRVFNHTKEFTVAAGSPAAQENTLTAAKAMAMTALKLLRSPNLLKQAKKQFLRDIVEDADE